MNVLRLAFARGVSLVQHRPHAGRSLAPTPRPRSLVCLAASEQVQPKLTSAEKRALRTKSQQQNDSLVVVNCGAKGLTEPFLESLYDALRRNQLVKVRMGCSRQEKKDKEAEIEQRLDCVLVHSIGSTSIFYRQKGLSKPKGLAGTAGDTGRGEEHADDVGSGRDGGGDGKKRGKVDGDRIGGKGVAERPEFKVIS
jgi:RNA-binding protein YhbY